MKMCRLSLFLLCSLVAQLLHAEYFQHIGRPEGLSQLSVMAIYQDQLGRMWFGTREGINIFNKEKMTVYKGWFNNENQPNVRFFARQRSGIHYGQQQRGCLSYHRQYFAEIRHPKRIVQAPALRSRCTDLARRKDMGSLPRLHIPVQPTKRATRTLAENGNSLHQLSHDRRKPPPDGNEKRIVRHRRKRARQMRDTPN